MFFKYIFVFLFDLLKQEFNDDRLLLSYKDYIIKYNEFSDELISFENKLKNADNLTYMLYKYKFKENRTFEEISQLLDIETNRITEKLDKIDFAIRIYCKI